MRETTEREGMLLQEHLEEKVSSIFQDKGFTIEGHPQDRIWDWSFRLMCFPNIDASCRRRGHAIAYNSKGS